MRRHINDIHYDHEHGRTQMTLTVTLQGKSDTRLTIEYTTTGHSGGEVVDIYDAFGHDGIRMVMQNEGIDEMRAYGVLADVLSDVEQAERLNARARAGLSHHVVKSIAMGGTA